MGRGLAPDCIIGTRPIARIAQYHAVAVGTLALPRGGVCGLLRQAVIAGDQSADLAFPRFPVRLAQFALSISPATTSGARQSK